MTAPPTPPVVPSPSPPPRRRAAWIVLTGVLAAVTLVAWLILRNDDTTPEAGALDDAPTLQDLAERSDETPQDDEAAPDFSVELFEGGSFTLSHHLEEDGRPVILNLWASWCLPCREEMPALDAFAATHPEVAVVGVAVQDDPVAAEQFAADIGVGYALGFDEKEQVDGAYRAVGLPATFWVSSDGIIVKRMFGGVTVESLEADVALFDEPG